LTTTPSSGNIFCIKLILKDNYYERESKAGGSKSEPEMVEARYGNSPEAHPGVSRLNKGNKGVGLGGNSRYRRYKIISLTF